MQIGQSFWRFTTCHKIVVQQQEEWNTIRFSRSGNKRDASILFASGWLEVNQPSSIASAKIIAEDKKRQDNELIALQIVSEFLHPTDFRAIKTDYWTQDLNEFFLRKFSGHQG